MAIEQSKRVYYPWIVLALVFGGHLGQAIATQGIPVLYPFIQAELGLSRAQVGFITSSTAASGAATVLLAGWLSDRLGVKRVLVIAMVSMAIVLGAFTLANSFHIILVLAAFIGIAYAPMYPSSTRAIIDWLPSRVLGLAMSLKQAGVPIGGALAAAVMGSTSISVKL